MNTKILWNMSYGVYVIGTMDNERPTGCIANSVMQVTSTPATVALSMNHDNYTNSCIKACGKFSVSILSEETDPGIIGTFGFQSGKAVNKFEAVPFESKEGIPVILDACGYMVFKVTDSIETSTHTVFIGELIAADVLKGGTEMTYAYYHKVVKGKSPKNAPTYQPEDKEEVKKSPSYRCSVCGYVYEGEIPFEELPEDYKCPICQQPKSVFVKE
ncbi:MAG: flavin reductase [Lachnospiraceae bacterium]|nr:flavin reductase [Lachnospiraceae bacterium]